MKPVIGFRFGYFFTDNDINEVGAIFAFMEGSDNILGSIGDEPFNKFSGQERVQLEFNG